MVSIKPTLVKIVGKPFQMVANFKPMQRFCDKFETSPDKMIAYTTMASIIGKDSIGCYMYVKQSLNNEKIPEEKRSFVAALDLTNGALMIISQLIAFFTLNKASVQNKLFGKFFDKVFDSKSVKNLITTIRNSPTISANTSVKVDKSLVNAEIEKVKKSTKDVFGFITSLIASTTIAKRVIVPFLATPLAGWAQEKFIDKDKNKSSKSPEKNEVDVKPEKDENISVNPTETSVKEQEFKGNLLDKYKVK